LTDRFEKLGLDYERDSTIDANALDVEWLKQPELMRSYAKYAAYTQKELDMAKERLNTGKAEIEMKIRQNPKAYGLDKVTDAAVQSAVLLQDEYQKLSQLYINARYENDIANAVVRAIDQKKTALENLVKLLGTAYFAGPRIPRNLSVEWLKDQERRNQNKKIRMSKQRTKDLEKAFGGLSPTRKRHE